MKSEKLSKEKRISAECERINSFFEKADGNQRKLVTPLIQNAAFMRVTLEDLQEIINSEGVTEVYQNGANQSGVKQSATLQSYNALIKNYTSVIKALSSILPPEEKRVSSNWSIIPEKTEAQKEEERQREEEQERKKAEELRSAIEYQKQQRERAKAGLPSQSFSEWKREQGEHTP